MKILGIFGSPRRQGNSDTLMQAFLQGAAETGALVEEIFLRDLKFPPAWKYIIVSRMAPVLLRTKMRGLYDKLVEADVVALGRRCSFTVCRPRPRP